MKKYIKSIDSILNKRQKIILTTFIITLGFILTTQTVNIVFRRYYFILVLGLLAYLLSLWSLWQGMTRQKAIVLMILPVLFSMAVPAFYFLFQYVRWLTRVPAALVFGLSFYWLLLSQNVLNVASDRAIPLYRAASTANFVYTIFISTLLNSIIFSLNLPFYWNGVLVFLFSFPLILQALWSIKIEKLDVQIIVYSGILSMILGEAAIAFSFWFAAPLVISLYLSSINYVLLGILSEHLKERLSHKAIIEYSEVGGLLFILIFLITTYFA